MACAKHFVGDGGTVNGINEDNTVINREGLMNIHMPAYFDALAKGVSTVMISYSSWNGVKMHANQDLVTGYLKDTLKFKVKNQKSNSSSAALHGLEHSSDVQTLIAIVASCLQGFVISDWEGIDRITTPAGSDYSLGQGFYPCRP